MNEAAHISEDKPFVPAKIITDINELVKPCVAFDKKDYDLINLLENTLRSLDDAIGLAGPQIGIFKTIFCIKDSKSGSIKTFINPQLLEKKYPFIFKGEGCVSFPDKYIDTIRYNTIIITDENNGPNVLTQTKEAIVFQHEYDHITQKTMFDHRVPELYGLCFCDSGKKFKFCCKSKLK